MKLLPWLFLLCLVLFPACTKKDPLEDKIKAIEVRISELEKLHEEYSNKITAAKEDAGNQNTLAREQELLHSRIQRLKEQVKNLRAKQP